MPNWLFIALIVLLVLNSIWDLASIHACVSHNNNSLKVALYGRYRMKAAGVFSLIINVISWVFLICYWLFR